MPRTSRSARHSRGSLICAEIRTIHAIRQAIRCSFCVPGGARGSHNLQREAAGTPAQ